MALTALVLLGVHLLIDLIREARSVGGDYTAAKMIWYVLQTTPRRLSDIFPFAALIGSLLGLGALTSSNEVVAMRAAGFDRGHIAGRALLVVALCVALMLALAEWVIPGLEAQARAERQQAKSGQLHIGQGGRLWLRDGSYMIRLDESIWRDEQSLGFGNVLVYRLDESMQPVRILEAGQATHSGSQWLLQEVAYRELDRGGATGYVEQLALDSRLSADLFSAVVSRPRLLALADLARMSSYLSRNDLDASAYEQAFWQRAYFPLNVLAMVLLALPFVFRSARSGGRSPGLFIGVSLGLGFFVLSRLSQSLAMVWPLPLWLSMLLPALFIGMAGVIALRRV